MGRTVKVRDAMSTEVFEISEEATIQAAAKRMTEAHVNSLVVRPGSQDDPFGIVTSTDIVYAIATGLDPGTVLVREIAVAPLVVITPGVPLAYAARLMRGANLRHLAVFNGRDIVGILSAYDVTKAVGEHGSIVATGGRPEKEVSPAEAR
jgi:CBS domain-containing protein